MNAPSQGDLPLVDGHLDLAENVTLFGRDLTASVAQIRRQEQVNRGAATVSLPELRRGGIAVVMATVTAGFLAQDVGAGKVPPSAIYHTPQEAEAQALRQVALYQNWEKQGWIRLVKSRNDLDHHLGLWTDDRVPGLVLLMEGADPIVQVRDLPQWWQRGLRLIGLTFGDTRYGRGVAGGSLNFKQGGLSAAGIELLGEMGSQGFIWDISHLTEEGIWSGLELGVTRVCASHANVRAITPTDRHLSDPVIRALATRGGVIGLVLYNAFLEPSWKKDQSIAVRLDPHLRSHAEHIANLVGWSHVGLGSDLDGGFGQGEIPLEIDTIADLYKVGSVVPAQVRAGVLGGNWRNFLRASLPQTS